MITIDPGQLDDAALETEICTTFARRDAESHRLLALIREHDARGTWCGWGIRSCAHWLMWRCGLEAGTAREKVRVARALGALPTFDAMLRTGELSYSKIRAATRVATPEKEAELARLAKITTAAQLESVCRGIRQVEDVRAEETARDAGDEAPARPERWVRLKNGESGMMRLEAQLHPDECAMVMEAIEQARGLQTAPHEEPAGPFSTLPRKRETDCLSLPPSRRLDRPGLMVCSRWQSDFYPPNRTSWAPRSAVPAANAPLSFSISPRTSSKSTNAQRSKTAPAFPRKRFVASRATQESSLFAPMSTATCSTWAGKHGRFPRRFVALSPSATDVVGFQGAPIRVGSTPITSSIGLTAGKPASKTS